MTTLTSCSDDPDVQSGGRVEVSTEPISVEGIGGVVKIEVKSNAYWNVSAQDDEGVVLRWVTSDIKDGMGNATVTLTVDRNTSTSERKANIVIATDSEESSSVIVLTQAGGAASVGGYDFPLADMFQIDEAYALSNGYIEGNSCYLDGGAVITRTGEGDAKLTFSCPCHNATKQQYYQRGIEADNWTAGNAWLLEIPVKDALFGDLRYGFGSRSDNMLGSNPWTIEWSSDGSVYTPFPGAIVQGAAEAVWKLVEFSIPEAKKVPAGGKLYIRMTPTDPAKVGDTARPTSCVLQNGFQIFNASAPASQLPAADAETIVFSHGFDDVRAVNDATDITLDQGFFNSCRGGAYTIPEALRSVVAITNGYDRPGYLHLGTAATKGTYAVTLTHLEQMNILRTDVKVSLLAAAVQSVLEPVDGDILVEVDDTSGATVDNGGKAGVVKSNAFGGAEIIVRKATPKTVITISNANTLIEHRICIDDVLIEVEGTPERPSASDPTKVAVADIRAMYTGSDKTIEANNFILGRVVALDNMPAGCFAVADNASGLVVKAAITALAVGDEVRIVVKGGKLSKQDGMILVTPATAADATKTAEANVAPTAASILLADLTSGSYEGRYVKMPASQVVDADLSKQLNGQITLQTADNATYIMKTLAGASFATQSVPQGSGVVCGIVVDSKLMPSSAADLAAMTAPRFGKNIYAIKPMSEFFLADPTTLTLANKEYSVYTCALDEGAHMVTFNDSKNTVQRMGGASDRTSRVAAVAEQLYNGRFITTGWSGDDVLTQAVVIKMKATSDLKGKLRFGFGWQTASKAGVPKSWKMQWSANGSSWNDGVEVAINPFVDFTPTFAVTNAAPFKMSRFTIPEGQVIAAGSWIYLRIMPATDEPYGGTALKSTDPIYLHHGFYLSTDEVRAYQTTDLPSGGNVLFTYGFDEAIHGHDYFIPARHFLSNLANLYIPDGWTGTGETRECPGYVMFGGSSNAKAGTLTTPALTVLGDTPTNITVSFKLAFFMPANYSTDSKTFTVEASGAGAAGTQPDYSDIPDVAGTSIAEMDKSVVDYVKWRNYSVKISGATKDTKLTFKTTAGRHFIDDVVITKD